MLRQLDSVGDVSLSSSGSSFEAEESFCSGTALFTRRRVDSGLAVIDQRDFFGLEIETVPARAHGQ